MPNDFQDFDPRSPDAPTPDSAHSPPKRISSTTIFVAMIGVVLAILVVVCCGVGAWVVAFGLDVVAAEIENELRDHPKIQEHIGVIEEFEMDLVKSAAEDGDDVFVYRIKGPEGEGYVVVESVTNDEGAEEIHSATLRLKTGEQVDVIP